MVSEMNRTYAYPQVTFLGSNAGVLSPPAPPQRPAQPVPQRDLVRASLVLCPKP